MTPIRSLLLTTACLTLLVPSLGRACINDTDTVEFELKNMSLLEEINKAKSSHEKGLLIGELVIRAAAGRFDRYPKKYYEMRTGRHKKGTILPAEMADDIAVAYDRLGDSKSAIEVILASKVLRLGNKEEMYRFRANYGTFLAHDWLKRGAKKSEVKQLDEAARQIELGLKIRPDAHFGRERIQLQVLCWLAAKTRGKEDRALYDYLAFSLKREEIAIGLCGLVMMGAAYESPDVFAAIARCRPTVSSAGTTVAAYRTADLMRTRRALSDFSDSEVDPLIGNKELLTGKTEGSKLYLRIRKDGETVHQKRTAYMMERLNKGEHPDWDHRFWSDWEEPPYPVIERRNFQQEQTMQIAAVGAVVMIGLPIAAVFSMRKRAAAKKANELPIN